MRESEKEYRNPIQTLVYCYRTHAEQIEYLMLRRIARLGGFWQGITGAPVGDEPLSTAALRELREETQIQPLEFRQVDFRYSFPVDDEWRWAYHPDVRIVDEYVFVARIARDAEPVLSFEHEEYRWTAFENAMQLLKYENNRHALAYCNQLVRANLK
jgi:8-oxo-dGTP pyrophosphatase MutT (NUDIX family)